MERYRDLWQEYGKTRAQAVRERLVLNYLPLVKWGAARLKQILPQSVQLSDLEGAGVRGLIQSVEGFDPERGVRFESYAANRIKGAMLDNLRESDWLPRSLRNKMKQLERAFENCEARLGHIPDDDDVAAELGLPIDDYFRLLGEVGSLQLVSLDEQPEGSEGAGSFHEVIADPGNEDPLDTIEREEQRRQVVEWLKKLPEQMRRVMVLYYYEDLTLKEIGKILHLSESRICQIHAAAIHSLQAYVQQEQVA